MGLKKIVVVGGGFAGINFIKKIAPDDRFDIVLVDQLNYNFFPPLLYQVATAYLDPSAISHPFRRIFKKYKNVNFHMGELESVDVENNIVVTSTGKIDFDYVVFAMGTETNYFGMEDVKKNAFPMKTLEDSLNIRNHVLLNLEKASRCEVTEERDKILNVVIAGGGPSGVEYAGMVADLGKHVVLKEYPSISFTQSHIYLIDALPVLLAPMSKKAHEESRKTLEKLGVNVILETPVKGYSDGVVKLGDGTEIKSDTLIWTSGVIAREVPGLPAEVIGRGRRIMVNEYNQVEGFNNIFAIGDQCIQTSDESFPQGHPQLAQVAIQQGVNVASNICKFLDKKPLKEFRYNNKGTMAVISKYKAVVDLASLSFSGFFAWIMWLFVHLFAMIGFRNKAKTAFSWLASFMTNDPIPRFIIQNKNGRGNR